MTGIPVEELHKIPFLTRRVDAGRLISCLAFYVNGEWHNWIWARNTLVKIRSWPHEANYFGDRAERDTDQRFLLLELLAQRTLCRSLYPQFHGIWNDFQNLAASLAKLKMFFHRREDAADGVCRFVQAEIEYIAVVCRSVFDLLQEIVAAHWDRIQIAGRKNKRKLPSSFADVIRDGETPRSAKRMQDKYGLLPQLAQWYAEHAGFLLLIRGLRDSLVHRGATVELIFVTDRGFAVQKSCAPFADLHEWSCESVLPNNLVPLRPVLCRMVQATRNACDSFADVLAKVVQLPEELAPGLKLYSRGLHDKELSEIDDVVTHSKWCDT